MPPNSQTQKLAVLLAILTLALTSVSADDVAESHIDFQEDVFWLNEGGSSAHAYCHNKNITRITVEQSGEASFTDFDFNTTEVYIDYDFVSSKEDQINFSDQTKFKLECEGSTTKATNSFEVRKLKASVLNSDQVFRGYKGYKLGKGEGTESLRSVIEIEGRNGAPEPENLELSFDQGPLKDAVGTSNFESVYEDNYNFLISPAVKDLNVENDVRSAVGSIGLTKGQEVKSSVDSIQVNISEPWDWTVLSDAIPDRSLDYKDFHLFAYHLQFNHLGQNQGDRVHNIYPENFTVTVIDQEDGSVYEYPTDDGSTIKYKNMEDWVELEWFSEDDPEPKDTYNLTMKRPKLEVGEYVFKVKFNPSNDGSYNVITMPVTKQLNFDGRVHDSQGRAVETLIELTDIESGVTQTMETTSQGRYSKDIDPVEYDVNLDFGTSKVFITEAKMEERAAINYEYDPNTDLNVQGLSPINIMAVEFGYPLQSAKARMGFDSEGVNPEKLEIFECTSWNFEGRKCLSQWEKVNSDKVTIDYTTWKANFPIEPHTVPEQKDKPEHKILTNAYVIGTNSDLGLNNGIRVEGTDQGRIPVKGDLTVSGRAISENENFLEGAEVELEFRQGGETVDTLSATTSSDGEFSIGGEAPEEPGTYDTKITITKSPFNDFTKTFEDSFDVFVEEGVRVETDGEMTAKENAKAIESVKIKNVGQTEVTDISVSLSGDNEHVSLSSRFISSLDAGDSKDVDVTVQLPEDYCDPGCGTYPSFKVSAEGTSDEDTVSHESNIQVTSITREGTSSTDQEENTSTQQSQTTNTSEDSGLLSSTSDVQRMAGEVWAEQSINIALGLIMVFTMVLAGAVKKKKEDGSDRRGEDRGDGRPSIQKPVVGGDDSGGQVQQVKPETKKPDKDSGEQSQDEEIDGAIDQMEGDIDEDEVDEQIDEIASAVAGEEETYTDEGDIEDEEESVERTEEVEEEREEDGAGEESGDGSEVSGVKCEVCGEEFDTESGRKLHEQAVH